MAITFTQFRTTINESVNKTFIANKITVVSDIRGKLVPGSYADILYKILVQQFEGRTLTSIRTVYDELKKVDLCGYKVIPINVGKDEYMFGNADDFIIKVSFDISSGTLTLKPGTGSDLIPSKADKEKVMHVISKLDKIIPGTYGEYIFNRLLKTFEDKPILDETKFSYTLKSLAFPQHSNYIIQNADKSYGFKGIAGAEPTFNCKIYFSSNGEITLYGGKGFNTKPPKETKAPSEEYSEYMRKGGLAGSHKKISSRNFFNR